MTIALIVCEKTFKKLKCTINLNYFVKKLMYSLHNKIIYESVYNRLIDSEHSIAYLNNKAKCVKNIDVKIFIDPNKTYKIFYTILKLMIC